MSKPKDKCWMAGSNLAGLWSDKPICGYKDPESFDWYDRGGNLNVSRMGLDARDQRCVTFASKEKRDVELWISGWMVAMRQVLSRIPPVWKTRT